MAIIWLSYGFEMGASKSVPRRKSRRLIYDDL
jgi:hypothetical protein